MQSQLEQLKVAKTALEAELSMMSSLSPTAQRSAGGVIPPYLPQQPNGEAGKGDTPSADGTHSSSNAEQPAANPNGPPPDWVVEMETLSVQLVTASLGHAQAEQDRLEAKQQVYRLKDANRMLRERLTAVELQLAKANSGGP
mmetsp:Transcript_4796/g.14884  ORF Transcript_4796/g.14884 Transcript_4796/m.14884 type:complete len:142 (-) Transcript_4796:43-468(-)